MSAQVVHKKTGKNTAGGRKAVNAKKSVRTKKPNKGVRCFVDVLLAVLLLCLMARQETGYRLHEWLGAAMAVLLLLHHLLNIRWIGSFFKGRYTLYRIILTAVNLAMFAAVILTVYCGLCMSTYVLPSFSGIAGISFSRQAHAAFAWWSFALMGLHLGLHMASVTSRLSDSYLVRRIVNYALALAAGTGLWLLIRNGVFDCMFFRTALTRSGPGKPLLIVFAELLTGWFFFVWIGIRTARLLLFNRAKKKTK